MGLVGACSCVGDRQVFAGIYIPECSQIAGIYNRGSLVLSRAALLLTPECLQAIPGPGVAPAPRAAGCWTLLCSQLLSGHWVKRERPGWSFSASEHPQASGQGSGFLRFDRRAAQMKPLSAPSGGFTLPQVLIFSRCFT